MDAAPSQWWASGLVMHSQAAYRLPRCPACGSRRISACIKVVGDCSTFDLARSSSLQKAQSVAQAAGVMGPLQMHLLYTQINATTGNWYLLTGRPSQILGLEMDAPAHFAWVLLHGEEGCVIMHHMVAPLCVCWGCPLVLRAWNL